MKTKRFLSVSVFLLAMLSMLTVAHDGYYVKPIIRGKQHWDRHYDSAEGKEVMAYGKREYRTWELDNGDYRHHYYVLCRVKCNNDYLRDGSFYMKATIFGKSVDKGWQFGGSISEHVSKRDGMTSADKVPPLSYDCKVKSFVSARHPSSQRSFTGNVDY